MRAGGSADDVTPSETQVSAGAAVEPARSGQGLGPAFGDLLVAARLRAWRMVGGRSGRCRAHAARWSSGTDGQFVSVLVRAQREGNKRATPSAGRPTTRTPARRPDRCECRVLRTHMQESPGSRRGPSSPRHQRVAASSSRAASTSASDAFASLVAASDADANICGRLVFAQHRRQPAHPAAKRSELVPEKWTPRSLLV